MRRCGWASWLGQGGMRQGGVCQWQWWWWEPHLSAQRLEHNCPHCPPLAAHSLQRAAAAAAAVAAACEVAWGASEVWRCPPHAPPLRTSQLVHLLLLLLLLRWEQARQEGRRCCPHRRQTLAAPAASWLVVGAAAPLLPLLLAPLPQPLPPPPSSHPHPLHHTPHHLLSL